MKWNWRICKDSKGGYDELSVREVYYGEDWEVEYYSEQPEQIYGHADVDELIDYMELMLKDIKSSKDQILDVTNLFND